MKEEKGAKNSKKSTLNSKDKGRSSKDSADQKPLLTTKNLDGEGNKKDILKNRTSLNPGIVATDDANTDYKDLILEEEEIECSEEGHCSSE